MPNNGVLGMNHIGVTVRSLDATISWYKDVLDIEPRFRLGGASDSGVDAAVQVEGAIIDCAFFALGNTCIEFLEYREPEGRAFELRNCDVGAIHICFEVDDLQAVYERLQARGVEFSTAPRASRPHLDGGPLAGISFVYFRDLEGLQYELVQIPSESPARA